MTRLEELKAILDAAENVYDVAIEAALVAADAAWAAYYLSGDASSADAAYADASRAACEARLAAYAAYLDYQDELKKTKESSND